MRKSCGGQPKPGRRPAIGERAHDSLMAPARAGSPSMIRSGADLVPDLSLDRNRRRPRLPMGPDSFPSRTARAENVVAPSMGCNGLGPTSPGQGGDGRQALAAGFNRSAVSSAPGRHAVAPGVWSGAPPRLRFLNTGLDDGG